MKIILLLSILTLATPTFASQRYPTRNELRETVEHMIAIGKDQQAKLSQAKSDNLTLGNELMSAKSTLAFTIIKLGNLQNKIDVQTIDLSNALTANQNLTADLAKSKAKYDTLSGRYHRAKFWICSLGALFALFLALYTLGDKVAANPYAILAAYVAWPLLVYGALWAFF